MYNIAICYVERNIRFECVSWLKLIYSYIIVLNEWYVDNSVFAFQINSMSHWIFANSLQ